MRLRVILLAPVLLFIALGAWALASPAGASPDDDFHLISTWCATGDSAHCLPGTGPDSRVVPAALVHVSCYAFDPNQSAACQKPYFAHKAVPDTLTSRGNFAGAYPPVYYAVMSWFVGGDIQTSALAMRLFNILLFVGLTTLVFALLPAGRRPTLLWGWLITTVPLGLFLIASNNPSGWAVTGVGTAWIALLGYFETDGRRRIGLGGAFALAVLMAAGSRGDSALYVIVAIGAVLVLKFARKRSFLLTSLLPLAAVAMALAFAITSHQVGGTTGTPVAGSVEPSMATGAVGLHSFGLVAYNLLNVPSLWAGVFGGWGLGWLDTTMPAIVLWSSAATFIAVGFVGLARWDRRKAIVAAGVGVLLVLVPVSVLTASGNEVGEYVQPRYLLPLIVLLAGLLMLEPKGKPIRFTRGQLLLVACALSIGNLVALEANIRRYVTGIDAPGLNLDAGREWWWNLPFGPNLVWMVGSVAFAGVVFLAIREIASVQTAVGASLGPDGAAHE